VRKTMCLLGSVLAGSGLTCIGMPAYADSTGNNDGIGLLNGDNISIAPIQVCGESSSLVGAGAISDLISGRNESSSNANCANAPVVDHSRATQPVVPFRSQSPFTPVTSLQPVGAVVPSAPTASSVLSRQPHGQAPSLPSAPAPVAVSGHSAVTG
jgi:hypothetical protein